MATPMKPVILPSDELAMRQIALDHAVRHSDVQTPAQVTARATEYLRFLRSGTKPRGQMPEGGEA